MTMQDIQNLIYERRIELGLSQQELSALSGITQGTISKVEKQVTGLSLEVFLKLLGPLELGFTLFKKD